MQGQVRKSLKAVRSVVGTACLGSMVLLSGCQNFFVCQKASCPSSGSTTTSGDLVYVANGTSGANYVAGYDIGKGALTPLTNSQYGLGITPGTMLVTRNNKFMYATEDNALQSVIRGWTINTDGSLSAFSSGSNALVTQATVAAMDTSADGQWLVVANTISTVSTPVITIYAINSSTGALTQQGASVAYNVPSTSSVIQSLKVAPSGNYIAMALGTGGVLVFPFNTSNGAVGNSSVTNYQITFGRSTIGAFDLAVDSNNNLFIAETGQIETYGVSSNGAPDSSAKATIATASGSPFSIVVDGASYVYAGASNLIYCFSNASGVLTALATPTIAAPATTAKLGVDSSGKYLLAAGYDTSAGLTMYTIGTGGVLSSLAKAGTGSSTTVATAIALTH